MQDPDIIAPSEFTCDCDTQSDEDSPSLDNVPDLNQSAGTWARLVSVHKLYPNIQILEDEATVGRADAEGNKRISKSHCRIYRDVSSGKINMRNLSGKGTLVNGILLGKDECTAIQQGDEVVLGPYTSGYPLYIFQILKNNVQHEQHEEHDRKRVCQFSDTAIIGYKETEVSPFLFRKKLKMSEDTDNFKCCICLNIWHDVVSTAPCLHNFCNGCFSEWYKGKKNYGCKCPQCREPVISVGRNHTLRNLVEEFLEEYPSSKRSIEDIAKLDQTAIVKSDFMKLAGGDDHSYSSDSDGGDDESEDWNSEHCLQCLRPNTLQDSTSGSGFHCGPQTVHLLCSACHALMPERLDMNVPQRCAGCCQIFCDSYWRSQNISGANGVAIGCISSGSLKAMNERSVPEIPRGAFTGNAYEQDVTKRYISEQRLEIQDVIWEWLNKMDRGEIEQPSFSGNQHASITSGSHICNQCADTVVQHLLYQFRLSVPKIELPPDAAGREDCWYGRLCRTQIHKEAHARKLNHVCEPVRQAR